MFNFLLGFFPFYALDLKFLDLILYVLNWLLIDVVLSIGMSFESFVSN